MAPLQDTVDILSAPSPPWWGQPKYSVGVIAAIAAALIWFLMSVVVEGQKALATAQVLTQQTLEQHETDRERDDQRGLRLLELICLNTSTNERERASCQAVTR